MIRRPPRPPRSDTLFPYPTLFRSDGLPDLLCRDLAVFVGQLFECFGDPSEIAVSDGGHERSDLRVPEDAASLGFSEVTQRNNRLAGLLHVHDSAHQVRAEILVPWVRVGEGRGGKEGGVRVEQGGRTQ